MKAARLFLIGSVAASLACGAPSVTPVLPGPDAAAPLPTAAPASTLGDEDVAKASKAYLDLLLELRPEAASELGIHDADDRLEDRSAVGQQKIIDRQMAMAADVAQRFAGATLSRAASIDLRILRSALVVDARFRKEQRPWARRPDFYSEPMQALFQMTARDYAPAAERAKNALARIEAIPASLKEARGVLKEPPAVWVQVGIESAGGAKEFFDTMRPFLEKALPSEKPRIAAALKGARDAYAEWKTFLEKDVKPSAPSGGEFASGREFFDWMLKEQYFLAEDADALLTIGIRVFGETVQKLEEVAHRIDPEVPKEGGWQVVVRRVKGKHPSAAELLPAYRKEMARARKFLVDKDVVAMPPGDQCDVMDTPPFQRSTVSAAYDQPPPFASQTKGLFFVTPVDKTMTRAQKEQMLRENDYGDIVDTVVHEAYPGHHLQLSFARLHPSTIRKATGPSIFSEGWALYTEELMSELGYYKDEERLMQLVWTLVRSARVMIDIGLHTKNMTFEQAVKTLTDEVGLERELAMSEVKRYTMTPTQPLAYLIGREKLFALRERVKARDGKAFSLKKFHEEVLTKGTVAPSLVEEEIFGK
ncbi:MAG: DUF885 domain-containing protein [Myxococcales bacterium]|nr:DUF885 domain-containing protein [Myxococcales bacterium]